MTDADAMRQAIGLAWQGWGRVHPNPLVGAVVLAGGEPIAQGYHAEFAGLHAEAAALQAAGERARGAVLVVTLEPCAHEGKQPPCTEAIIRAGVSRVVAAIPDPNPVAGGGAALLRAASIPVEFGPESEAARFQNAPFLHRFAASERPFVALKLATTVDGKIADRAGRSRWISGPEARDFVHWLRAGFDAIGVGGHTARTDDARLTPRGTVIPRKPPIRVVFDRLGELPPNLGLVKTARETPTMVVADPKAAPGRLLGLEQQGITVHRAPTLVRGLAQLRSSGIDSILIEGGGRLAGALLGAGLVDRFYWIQSPLWLGESAVPAFAGLGGSGLVEAERWRVIERRALGEDSLLIMERRCSPAS